MVAQGEGRSPTTSSDAETDFKPIIIIIIMIKYQALSKSYVFINSHASERNKNQLYDK